MDYTAFSRVPVNCGIWRKLKPVDTERWLRTLLQAYINEETKALNRAGLAASTAGTQSARRGPIQAGTAMVAGEDYTPFASGIWTFGHVASEASKRGLAVAYAQPEETIGLVADWWSHDRRDSAIKAHHVVASFDSRIAQELQVRGYPVDAMLLSSFHQTLSQYASRHYPGDTLGWVAGCHHDRAHAHVHALIHPSTADGTLIRMSGLKEGEPGEDKFDFLRTTFNTRSRQLFVGLTQQPKASVAGVAEAAKQMMLLSRHALKSFPEKPVDALSKATDKVADCLGSRGYSLSLEAAVTSASEEFLATRPSSPDPTAVKSFWSQFHEDFGKRRSAHLDCALDGFKVITDQRKGGANYQPVRSITSVPLPLLESEYCALAGMGGGKAVASLDEALTARRENSEHRRVEANRALLAYHASIDRARRDLDELQVRVAGASAQIALQSCVALGVPFSLIAKESEPGAGVQRALPSPDRVTFHAEKELGLIAAVEARAHAPADPGAKPGLLATDRSLRFRELASPAQQIHEHPLSL